MIVEKIERYAANKIIKGRFPIVPKSVKGTIRKIGKRVVKHTPPVSCSGLSPLAEPFLVSTIFDKMIYTDHIRPPQKASRSPLSVSKETSACPAFVSTRKTPRKPRPNANPNFHVNFSLRNRTDPMPTKTR